MMEEAEARMQLHSCALATKRSTNRRYYRNICKQFNSRVKDSWRTQHRQALIKRHWLSKVQKDTEKCLVIFYYNLHAENNTWDGAELNKGFVLFGFISFFALSVTFWRNISYDSEGTKVNNFGKEVFKCLDA